MPLTYQAISNVTVGAGGATFITLSSIPQTFTDLIIKGSTRSTGGGTFSNVVISFNGSSADYTLIWLGYANGSAVSFNRLAFGTNQFAYEPGTSATANTFGNFEAYLPNYTSSANKSLSIDGTSSNNSANTYFGFSAGLWSNSASITSITLTDGAGSFAANSTFTLYGIKKD